MKQEKAGTLIDRLRIHSEALAYYKELSDLRAERIAELEAENTRLREVLQSMIENPIIDGMSARIRDHARQKGRTNSLERARAALDGAK